MKFKLCLFLFVGLALLLLKESFVSSYKLRNGIRTKLTSENLNGSNLKVKSSLDKSDMSLELETSLKSSSLLEFNKENLRISGEAASTGNIQKSFAKLFSFKSAKTTNFSSKNSLNSFLDSLSSIDMNSPCEGQVRPERGGCPNILSGWLKFMEITEVLPNVPNTFITNEEYYLQQSENQSMNVSVKDNFGYINIPNEQYFYFELNKFQLQVFTARTPKYRKMERFLDLDDLAGERGNLHCKGGVEDVGNFKEGYCFMLKFTRFTRFFVWELCADTPFEKDKWMGTLTRLSEMNKLSKIQLPEAHDERIIGPTGSQIHPQATILDNQLHQGNILQSQGTVVSHGLSQDIKSPHMQGSVTSNTLVMNTGNSITISTHHGPGWVPLGAWGPCSEPCGPGVQVRKLKCIMNDGCNGDDQEEKLCKLKECKKDLEDHLNNLKIVADCGKWKLLGEWTECTKPCGGGVQFRKRECVPANKPCIGKAEISQPCNMHACRIENEVDCKQIEGQLNMILELGKQPVPVHFIININEVAIAREPLLAPLATIPLNQIAQLQMLKNNPGCFSIAPRSQSSISTSVQHNSNIHAPFELCPEKRELSEGEIWIKKIQTFKENCNNKILDKLTAELETCNDLNPNDPKAQKHKFDIINQKALEAEKEKNDSKLLVLENGFNDFKRQVNEILEKEDAYEKGIEEQEKIKECKDRKATEAMIIKQQEAAQMLLHDIANLHQEDRAYANRENSIKREMKMMMEDVKNKIADKRGKLVSKIERMKTLHEIEQKKASQKLLEMKRSFGKELSQMSSHGHPQMCFTMLGDTKALDCYCDQNYPSGALNFDCKNPKKFCYLCCDREIGNIDHPNLDCCYNRCEEEVAKSAVLGGTNKCNGFLETYNVTQTTTTSINSIDLKEHLLHPDTLPENNTTELLGSGCPSGHCNNVDLTLDAKTNSIFN